MVKQFGQFQIETDEGNGTFKIRVTADFSRWSFFPKDLSVKIEREIKGMTKRGYIQE